MMSGISAWMITSQSENVGDQDRLIMPAGIGIGTKSGRKF